MTYVGRSPHGRSSQDGLAECGSQSAARITWRSRATTHAEKRRITVPNGPGMVIFSTDGATGTSAPVSTETVVISARDRWPGEADISPFCPNIAASPDGNALKDTGGVMVFSAERRFRCYG